MSIFDIFKKSPDYDPNLSWDKLLKSWEENFLGSGSHIGLNNDDFSNHLEFDSTFDNCAKSNDSSGSKYLFAIFDNTLIKDDANFTCINSECMNKFNNLSRGNQGEIRNQMSWTIPRNCDLISKPFFRLVLKPNLLESDIKNILYLLSDCRFIIEIGGATVLDISKLLFIFLICEKLNNPIKIFDVEKFLEENTMEEIKQKICKLTDKSAFINSKYYVEKSNSIYLDIPLLINFFSYNMSTNLLALQYHDVRYNLYIPENKINMLKNYMDNIVLMFEEIIYSDMDFRRKMAQNSFEFMKMQSKIHYYHSWTGNLIENYDMSMVKFIFIILRQTEITDFENGIINQIDKDIDITQFPQISNIEITEYYKNPKTYEITQTKSSSVDLENIWIGQYDNMVIYGIATDGISSMKNWIGVQSECVSSVEKLSFKDKDNNKDTNTQLSFINTNTNSQGINNINYANSKEIYRVVGNCDIKIYWSESTVPVNIEIIEINQNLQRIMCGMAGDAYCI